MKRLLSSPALKAADLWIDGDCGTAIMYATTNGPSKGYTAYGEKQGTGTFTITF